MGSGTANSKRISIHPQRTGERPMKNLALDLMPHTARRYVEDVFDAVGIATAVENKQVLVGMLPSVGRGFVLKRGKQGGEVRMPASYETSFDFGYGGDYPEMYELYR